MAGTFSLFTKKVFIILNSVAAVVFLLASLAPYLNPTKYWFIGLLGLGFALAFLTLVLFVVFWLLFKPRYALISLVPLIMGWQSVSVFFAFNNSGEFRRAKPKGVFRVVQWNVARFSEWRRNNNKGSQTRLKMMDQITAQNADVLCFQEFFQSTDSIYYNNISHIVNKLKYPYYHFSWDEDGGIQWVGQAIFSRYPIVGTGMIRYPRPGLPEALIYADINFNGDTIRFYTTHLQSVQFKKQDYERIEKIKKTEDSILHNSKDIFSKLKRGFEIRSRQADITKAYISESPHPTVITGDFNDVPNSYTYFTIRKNLQDAFLKKGFGIGRTFSFISPTLRIDYILASKDLQVQQFNRIVRDYSDHYMLVADLKLRD